MAYALGPVKPHVRIAANVVGDMFNVSTIYGVASRSYASDHPLGLALDYMTYGDQTKGNSVAAYVYQNARKLNVKYIIWRQHIWSADRSSEGWRQMEDRGSATANHQDHVHVSFNSVNSSGVTQASIPIPTIPPISPINPFDLWPGDSEDKIPGAIGGAVDGAADIAKVFGWLADGHNWLRIGLIVSGIVLLLFGLIKLGAVQSGIIPSAASAAGKVVKNGN